MEKEDEHIPAEETSSQEEVAKTSTYNHVMKSTGLLGGVQAFYILMSILRNKLTAILIGTAGIGLADLYCRTLELLGNTTNFGIAFSAVRRLSALYEEGHPHETSFYVRLIRTWIFIAALFGALVCLAFSPLISQLTTGSYDHIFTFSLLAPAVFFTTLAGGEMAILKGMRRLKNLALASAAGALSTVIITLPIYASMGIKGVLPVIIGTTALTFLLNLRAATRIFPYRISPLRKKFISKGGHLISLGSAYIAAGIIGSAAELLIRTVIVESDTTYHQAGLYAAGLTLTVSYARIIFVAMDADYFPRLSAALKDIQRTNTTINQQIDILVLLMAPLLILFATFLQWIVPLLYSSDFMEVIPMVLCALPYMFFKAVYSPIAYLPLAAGKSRLYLAAELMYYVAFSILIVLGYHFGGLIGAGLALSAANLVDLTVLPWLYGKIFGFHFTRETGVRSMIQGLLLIIALISCGWSTGWGYLLSISMFILSCWYSWRFLKCETAISGKLKQIMQKFKRK